MLPCSECRLWIYDDKGQPLKRLGKKQRRRFGSPTPCRECPKKSPAEAKWHELTADNLQALQFYREVQASGGGCLTDAMRRDRRLLRNLSIIDQIVKGHERHQEQLKIARMFGA